ncbi:MAG: sugar phosphate isomerase/epimerase [Acidobacteria bacterium]|nr:sugar phosphate isomerase/epimerase [Acidobacteriota bacterium]
MTIFPSACMWHFDTAVTEALRQVKETAFHYIDIETDTLDAPGALQAQKDLGLKVSCVALARRLPSGTSLDTGDGAALRNAVSFLKEALGKIKDLGTICAYVWPCADGKQLPAFGSAIKELAEQAAQKEIRLCIEHVPGRALPTAADALRFVQQAGHPNLYLLLDLGHTLLSGEKAWELIRRAGSRLGYVQMNDNDGKKDRHWPLLDGRLSAADLTRTLDALGEIGYGGTIGLEVSRDFGGVISGLSKNRNLLLRLQATEEIKSMQEPETRRKR